MSQQGYDSIMKRLRREPVRQNMRAVHLSQKKAWAGSGTLIMNNAGQHVLVVTAGHVFSTARSSEFTSYRMLQPFSSFEYPITSAKGIDPSNPSGGPDVAICTPGIPRRIPCFSKHVGGKWGHDGRVFSVIKMLYPPAISLTTGEPVPVIGSIHSEEWGAYFVLLYHSYDGESGSGFLKSENELYVLAAGIDVTPDLRSALDVPSSFSLITIVSAIRIGW